MSNWCSAALAALALASATPAYATVSLAGQWRILSINDEIGCRIDGEATLVRAEGETYSVTMHVAQSCNGEQTSASSEACTLRRKPTGMTVFCRVVESTSDGYLPDNFVLTESGDDL